MKRQLFSGMLLFSFFSFAETVYTPPQLFSNGKNAGFKQETVNPAGKNLYWKIAGIEKGFYSIQLEMESGRLFGVENLAPCLFLNGKMLDFDSAGPLFLKKKISYAIAQTPFILLKNGDEIQLSSWRNGGIATLKLSKERLPFAPQKITSTRNDNLEQYYDFSKTKFGENLRLEIKNKTGKKSKLKLEVKILDHFRNQVGGGTDEIVADRNFSKVYEYKKGASDQYRAYVTVTDENGIISDAAYPYRRDCAQKFRKKIWLHRDWMKTTVKDDGSIQSRTLAAPPTNAKWKKICLPTRNDGNLAWIKRDFSIPPEFRNSRYFLHFERLSCDSVVYLNGKEIFRNGVDNMSGTHNVEITGKFDPTKNNAILIGVRGKIACVDPVEFQKKDVNWNHVIAPSHVKSGIGVIYLEAAPENLIGNVKITTSFQKKTIDVQAKHPAGFSVKNKVSHSGKELLAFQNHTDWKNPVLWGPVEFPLLKLSTELYDKNGKLTDVKETRFGFREFHANGMTILWNGKPFRTTARPFLSGWGMSPDSTTDSQSVDLERIRYAKKTGNRMLRHIIDSESYAELCAEEGMIFSSSSTPIAGMNEHILSSETFWSNKKSNDRQYIQSLFNQPSVFSWYLSNECYAFSTDKNFQRVSRVLYAAQQHDPTRMTEAGCDLDLRGVSPLISTHYPVEFQAVQNPQTYEPDMFYWRDIQKPFHPGEKIPNGQIKKVCNVFEESPIAWGTKPIVINETGWISFFRPPLGMTRFVGDRVFESAEMMQFAHQQINKRAFRGHRDAGASVITPWRWIYSDSTHETVPWLDLVLIQKYHTFPIGTEVVFDVNLFHDVLKKETLPFYWKLMRNGKTVQEKKESFPVDFCETIRTKIKLKLNVPGNYKLVTGIQGQLEKEYPITVEAPVLTKLPKNVIPDTQSIADQKDALLNRARNGETIVLLARKDYPAWLPECPALSPRTPSINYTFRPDHPILNGIPESALSFWYPNHRTGNHYFIKPHAGNARTIIEAGGPDGLLYSGLIEVPYGKGCFLYSRLELDPVKNPIAAKLLANMGNYKAGKDFLPVGLIARPDSTFVKYLKKYGVVTEAAQFGRLAKFKVLIVDGETPFTPEQIAELKAFPGMVIVKNPGARFGISTQPILSEAWLGRAVRTGTFPELAGLTNQDFYYRDEPKTEDVRMAYYSRENRLDTLGNRELSGAEPMLYPVLLAKKGNMIFDVLNWQTDHPRLVKTGQRILSTLLTNLGVRIEVQANPVLPENLIYKPLDLRKFLDRSMSDDVENDGKGGFTDQGPESDMRSFHLKSGLHTLAEIPFRIETPKTCFALESKYRKGGYQSVEIPVNGKADVIAWLHTCAYTSAQHHYSVIVRYSDGTLNEIKMEGRTNLRDWAGDGFALPFTHELDTLTKHACTFPQKRHGKASLYRTAWLNPEPEKNIESVTLKSMKRGVPVILAFSIGMKPERIRITDDMISQHRKLVENAYQFQKNKKYTEAISEYEKALSLIPDRLEPYRGIGFCYESLGNYKKAAETYERSLKADINQPDILENLKQVKQKIK